MKHAIICPVCRSKHVTYMQNTDEYVCNNHHFFKLNKDRHNIFISYGHDDFKDDVIRLKKDLDSTGHLVWLDEDELSVGENFHNRISEDMKKLSDKKHADFIFIISRYSTRQDGESNYSYCLNELSLAKELGFRIIPVLVEDTDIPMDIKRLLFLDMRNCHPFHNNEKLYEENFHSLINKIENDISDHRFQNSDDSARLTHFLKPIEFESELSRHKKHYVGRKWILSEIEEWINDDKLPVLLIKGEPGTGKSALAAHLIDIYESIHAFHFCTFSHTEKSNPFRTLFNITFQLSSKLPGFKKKILQLDLGEITDKSNFNTKDIINSIIDRILIEPTFSLNMNQKKIVVLIDALDELRILNGNDLVEAIGAITYKIPECVKFIFTCRPQDKIISKLPIYKHISIDKNSEENMKDLREFISAEFSIFNTGVISLNDRMIENLLNKSEGIFQYAEMIRYEIEKGIRQLDSLENLDTLPKGLGNVYREYFNREYELEHYYDQYIRKVLEISFALKTSLPVEKVMDLLGWDEESKKEFLLNTGSLFVLKEGYFEPIHNSLYDWLVDQDLSKDYYINISNGHNCLIREGTEVFEKHKGTLNNDNAELSTSEDQLLTELPYHIMCNKNDTDLKQFIGNIELFIWYYTKDKFQLFAYLDYLSIDLKEFIDLLTDQAGKMDDKPGKENHIAFAFHIIGLFLYTLEYYKPSLPYLEEAIKHYKNNADNLKLAKAYNDAAESYVRSNTNLEIAKKYYMSAIRIMWRHMKEHADTADYINNLGHYYYYCEDFKRAEKLYKKAFEIRKRIFPPDHYAIAESHHNIGFIYVYRPKEEEHRSFDYMMGLDNMKTALDIQFRAGRLINKDTALYNDEIAQVIIKYENDNGKAIPYLENALAIRIALFGVRNYITTSTFNKLENSYLDMKSAEGCITELQKNKIDIEYALDKRKILLPPDHPELILIQYIKAILMLYKNKLVEAEKLIIATRENIQKQDSAPEDVIEFLKREANIFLNMGSYKETESIVKDLLGLCKKHYGISHNKTLGAFMYLVQVFLNLNMEERKKAINILDDVVIIIQEIFNHLDNSKINQQTFKYASIAYNEIAFHKFKNNKEWIKAEDYFTRAIEYITLAGDHTEIANINLNLQSVYHFSRLKPVDTVVVQKYTQFLEERNDERYQKGVIILNGAEINAVDKNLYKYQMLNICFAVAVADKRVDSAEIREISRIVKPDNPDEIEKFHEEIKEQIDNKGIETVKQELIHEAIQLARDNNYSNEIIKQIIIQLLIISESDKNLDPREFQVILKFGNAFGYTIDDINSFRKYF